MGREVDDKDMEFIHVVTRFRSLGFSVYAEDELKENWADLVRDRTLDIRDTKWIYHDKMNLNIHVRVDNGRPDINGYDASLRKEIRLPVVDIGSVHTLTLDKEMEELPWSLDPDDETVQRLASESKSVGELVARMSKVQVDLRGLAESDHPDGKEAAHLLSLYHWLDTPWEKHLPDAQAFKDNYDIRRSFRADDIFFPSVLQARNLLDGRTVGREITHPTTGLSTVEWFVINRTQTDTSGQSVLQRAGLVHLRNEIEVLPIREKQVSTTLEGIYNGLLNGEKPAIHFQGGSGDQFSRISIAGVPPEIEVHGMLGGLIYRSAPAIDQERNKSVSAKASKMLVRDVAHPDRRRIGKRHGH